MDTESIFNKQINDFIIKGDLEAALIACFSALQVDSLSEETILISAEIFTKLSCPTEAKMLYFICLSVWSQNGATLEKLRYLNGINSTLVSVNEPPHYVKKITQLILEKIAAKPDILITRWQRLDDDELEQNCWVASGLMKLGLPSMAQCEQEKWLEKFRSLFAITVKKYQFHNNSITSLPLHEKYFFSAFRYILTTLYLSYATKPTEVLLPLSEFILPLTTTDVWKLGCIDQHDNNLLKKIVTLFNSFTPGVYPDKRQFLICTVLMLFRSPNRIYSNMNSDAIFHFYLNLFKKQFPQQENNVYASRGLAKLDLPQEKALWFIENYSSLIKFRNKHAGESCYIIGNGPSLKRMDLSPLRNKVTFGLNKIYLLFDKLGFETSYLVAANAFVLQQASSELESLKMTQFLMMWGREFIRKKDNVIFLRENNTVSFGTDVTKGVTIDCTVTHMALQLAYYMGFKTVFLIGVDHSFVSQGDPHATITLKGEDPNHFDPSYFGYGIPWQLPDLEGSERAYTQSKKIFEADGRRILDATVNGKLKIFDKIDYIESLQIN